MWETLAGKLPWSWLTCITIKQALCDYQMTLPMLEIWPSYIRSIMAECLQDPADRPCFCTLHECLLAIKNSGDSLTSEVLDGAFPDWFDVQCGTAHIEARGRRKTSPDLPQRSSTCGTSEIYVMLRRPSSQGNGRRRSTSVRGGLIDTLKVLSTRAQDSPREKEIERFGYEIAERLAVVRNIRGLSRNYKRARWAREVVLTRALEGDIERVRRDEKTATSAKKRNKSSRRGRRHSVFNQESFERLLVTSSKYLRRDWSKVLHGKEKLKTSMKGFKGKVNEELSEYGRKLLNDDDRISEHSIRHEEADRTESQAASNGSLALLSLWENNRATLKPKTNFSVKGTSQEITHSKVDIDRPSSLYVQPVTTRRMSVAQEAGTQLFAVRKRSDVISDAIMGVNVQKINRTKDGKDGILPDGEYDQRHRSRRNLVTQNFVGNFQVRTNSDTQTVMIDTTRTSEIPTDRCFVILNSPREEPAKLKGEDQSEAVKDAETSLLNEADLSSSYDLNAKQPGRLRTQSLGPTPREKPLSARKSYKPRARSARLVRMETALALSERQGKSGTSAVVSDTEGTSLDKTALTDSDGGGNGRLHRFSIRPNMSQGIYLSPTPPQSFGSNDDLRDVRESKSAANGGRVSSVSYIDWSRLKVSDENELDMPTQPNSATGTTERDAIEAKKGTSREMLSCKETSSLRFPSDKSYSKRAQSLRNEYVGEFSLNRTILGEAETTISPCYDADSHGLNSYIKTEKLRSNSLSQKPIENDSTIKCNSLMIKGAGSESLSKRKTNAWEFSKDWSSSNISLKPRSKSLGGDLMAKLGLIRRKSGTDRLVHLSKGSENDLHPEKGSKCMHASDARSEEPTRISIQRDIAETNNSFGTKCSSEAIANEGQSVCSTEMVLKDLYDIIDKDTSDENSVDDKYMKAKEKPEVVSDENKTTHNNPAYINSRQTK